MRLVMFDPGWHDQRAGVTEKARIREPVAKGRSEILRFEMGGIFLLALDVSWIFGVQTLVFWEMKFFFFPMMGI
ncbi:hypothetical protein AOLI_G00243440 [Acnodon oligacanthus]